MTLRPRSLAPAALLSAMSVVFGLVLSGCASPGPPRAPSLQMPAPAKGATALRRGNIVELRFTYPHATSDGLPLKSSAITATACRAVGHEQCRPITAAKTIPVPPAGASAEGELTDTLPPELATGSPRVLLYRIQLANDRGRAVGYSDAAYTAAGAPLPPVAGLQAQGSRLGVVLSWQGAADDAGKVILRREDLNPAAAKPEQHEAKTSSPTQSKPQKHHAAGGSKTAPAKAELTQEPNVAVLSTGEEPGTPQGAATLDTTAVADEPYRYSAERRKTLELDGRNIELRSSMSAPVDFTLHDVFPPPTPMDLAVAGFADPQGKYAADLVWQPVDDPNLAGYNVYRETLDAASGAAGDKVKLNASALTLPAYHDDSVKPQGQYRYGVTAVDKKGNESAAATATLSSQPQ